MDERLYSIVRLKCDHLSDAVDMELLRKMTEQHALSFTENLNWNQVIRLQVIGADRWLPDGMERGCYVDPTGEWVLLIGAEEAMIQHCLDRCGEKLKRLDVSFTEVSRLRLPRLQALRDLHLRRNQALREVAGLEGSADLWTLNLQGSYCDFVLDLTPFPRLLKLDLAGSGVRGVRLSGLLNKLRYCGLQDTSFSDMDFLDNCPTLTELYFSGNPIRRVPEGVRRMKYLCRLQLEKLTLEALPDWLPELEMPIHRRHSDYGISLYGTTVRDADMSTFEQSQGIISDWFRQRKNEQADEPLNEIKVVFLGDGNAGKSLTVARLLRDGALPADFNGDATPGIAIEDRDFDLPDGRNVRVHFWDFGGQEILHAMHRIFLTDRTLYVVMVNARNNTQDDQANYWLHNISSFAPGCPVLLVLNQIDQNPNASVNELELRGQYPNLGPIVRLSAWTYDQETFNRTLTEKMLEQIAAFKSLGTVFPSAWKRIMDSLRGMQSNYIKGDDFRKLCEENGVDGDDLRVDLLKWFHDLGVSFCCSKSRQLRDYVVLKPEWITNGIYTIIWNKSDDAANGMVDQEEIYRLLSPEAGENVKKVNAKMEYKPEDVGFILNIARRFYLSFPTHTGKEFIPMLCSTNAMPEVYTFPAEPGVIEFRMEYDYLPANVLHRLMVDMRQDLRTDKVWRTGALLRQKYNGIEAMVKSSRNALTIYIRAADAAHKAHTYLNTIRGALDTIHRDLNLTEPETMVAYREGGRVEYFPYEILEGTRQNDVKMVYSRTFRRIIPIDDILNGSDSEVVRKHEKLLRDLVNACTQLQEEPLMFDTKENNRNKSLRNALRNMGYIVADQTLTGTGSTGRSDGSLDLQILHDANTVWTNLEAMNLDSGSPTSLKYWDNHLDRLMDNYNSPGLPNLFLISYVNCAAKSFHKFHSTYTDHMSEYAPPKGEPRRGTMTEIPIVPDGRAWLKVNRCTYDMGGTPVMVYHYFVGFVEDKEKQV